MVRVGVVIPAFNESSSISSLVEKISSLRIDGCEVVPIVINDASTDQTLEVLKLNKISYLNLPVNLGIGGAVQTGFIWAFEHGFDYAVQMDGDGQHPPEELYKLINAIDQKQADIVIGSRFIDNEGFQSSFWRRLGIKCISLNLRILMGIRITDPTSGFRIFNRRALALALKEYPDEYPEPESLVYFKLKGLTFFEIPVLMQERLGGVSSISGFKSIYYMLKVTIAMFFTHFRYRK